MKVMGTKTKNAFNIWDKDKKLSAKTYLNINRPCLSYIMNDYKTFKKLRVHSSNEVINYQTQFGECKIQLTMPINFISSKDSVEADNMHAKNNNIKIMVGRETVKIVEQFFKSFLQKYQ